MIRNPGDGLGQSISRWEHFAHMADMGVRGFGADCGEAFAQAAVAMTAIVCDPEKVQAKEAVAIDCEAADLELLLCDWLNALIYEMAVRRMLFSGFEVTVEGHALHAIARGEPVDRRRHQPAVEIKGATFTELNVTCAADGRWMAQCVVDV